MMIAQYPAHDVEVLKQFHLLVESVEVVGHLVHHGRFYPMDSVFRFVQQLPVLPFFGNKDEIRGYFRCVRTYYDGHLISSVGHFGNRACNRKCLILPIPPIYGQHIGGYYALPAQFVVQAVAQQQVGLGADRFTNPIYPQMVESDERGVSGEEQGKMRLAPEPSMISFCRGVKVA